MKALHNNDDKSNNALDNLRYGTSADNLADMITNNGGIHPRRKYTVPKPPPKSIKRDKFIEVYNTSLSLDEVCQKLHLKKKTVMESASRLRRWKYELQYFKDETMQETLTRGKQLGILLALEAGEITEEQALKVLNITRLNLRAMRLKVISMAVRIVLKDKDDVS